ncbi:MAG: efflux RND transporter permease subunit [Pseudomonadota bacterium]|nr:efflux RND transporter permease subunit [Pseudomonadota bacterium]
MSESTEYRGVIAIFARHKVAANLLMILAFILGTFALTSLNRQLFPDFEMPVISVKIPWLGASPEDVQESITVLVEQELKGLPSADKVEYFSNYNGMLGLITLQEDADTDAILEDVKQRINAIQSQLPADIEDPIVKEMEVYSRVFYLMVWSDGPSEELLPIARDIEQGLLNAGLSKIGFDGLPEEELAIKMDREQLEELGMNLNEVAAVIRSNNLNLPAGVAGRDDSVKTLRVNNKRYDARELANLPVRNMGNELLLLGDVAVIDKRLRDDLSYLSNRDGTRAVDIVLFRAKGEDTIRAANIAHEWLDNYRKTLPEGIHVSEHLRYYQFLMDRIKSLRDNGWQGLLLVIVVLLIFLNMRVAFWVGMGVPISFMIAFVVMQVAGGSINMISLLGFIIALGIIVDDAIVVGEEALDQYEKGLDSESAAIVGAQKMFVPIAASSLTTVAAFLPTTMFTGPIGGIVFDIPFIIICVIIASLVECFLILPGHLNHSLKKHNRHKRGNFRAKFDELFNDFTEKVFEPILRAALSNKFATIVASMCFFALSIVIINTGHLKWVFFPPSDTMDIRAIMKFVPGTPEQKVMEFMDHLIEKLDETEQELGQEIVNHIAKEHRVASGFPNLVATERNSGISNGTLQVEVKIGGDRINSNLEFINTWRDKVIVPAGIDELTISQNVNGPPGSDFELLLTHEDPLVAKEAAGYLKRELSSYAGVYNVKDNMPWGNEEYVLKLNAFGQSMGLNLANLSQQMRANLDGALVQSIHQGSEEIDIRVYLSDEDRRQVASVFDLPIKLPTGTFVSLSDVSDVTIRKSFERLLRNDGEQVIKVSADVDSNITNANQVFASLKEAALLQLSKNYSVDYRISGRMADDAKLQVDMKKGAIIALILMYVVLAWVFSSYTWPLIIMTTILFGVSSAIYGHYIFGGLLNIKFCFLSAIGIFGLSGIIVNNGIILCSYYMDLLKTGIEPYEALIKACKRRLRPVVLTSLTTIVGMMALLLDGSPQALFLKPAVLSITFGLAVGTFLVLMVVPAMLLSLDEIKPYANKFGRWLINKQ